MRTTMIERRHLWQSLSKQDKHQRLQAMRSRQQSQVAYEMLRLPSHLR